MTDLIIRKMELIATGCTSARITSPSEKPPCFENLGQWKAWLAAVEPETGSPPPKRNDWPNEPNYCRDCTRERRNEMRYINRCLFPNTVFIEVGEKDDKETVGTSQ